jgi:hypothetical protein
MSEFVVVKSFSNQPTAIVARAALEANGIKAVISSDDAGGMEPQLQLTRGVRLLVRSDDVTAARAVLDRGAG